MVAWKSWTWTLLLGDRRADVVGLAVGEAALDAAAGQPRREARPGDGRGPWRRRGPACGRTRSSRRPACRRACRAASGPGAGRRSGWSIFLASGAWAAMSPCESQLFDEPVSISSMKRTPRSASRRAIRHCQPKLSRVAALQAVEVERLVGLLATGRTPPAPRTASGRRSRRCGCGRPGRCRCRCRFRCARLKASARPSSSSCRSAGRRLPLHVGDRVLAGHDARALVVGGQEVVGEDLRAGVGQVRRDDDERRQVLVDRAQAVADPRARCSAGRRRTSRCGWRAWPGSARCCRWSSSGSGRCRPSARGGAGTGR